MTTFREQLILSATQGLSANPALVENAYKAVELLVNNALPGQPPEVGNIYEGMIAQAAIAIADNIVEKLEEGSGDDG